VRLRPRQVEALQQVHKAFDLGAKAVVLVAPTGMGKTAMAAKLIREYVAEGKRVWFLAHLREILEDTCQRLDLAGVKYGKVMAGETYESHLATHVVSVQTAARRQDLAAPDLVIIDECHLALAKTYQAVLHTLGWPRLLGLTATPVRLDGRSLGEMFDSLVTTCSTRQLIKEGLLAPIRYYAPRRPALEGIRVRGGDYALEDVAAVMDRARVTGDAVEHYARVCPRKRAVAFCSSVEHAKHVAQEFVDAGFRAVAVHGTSSKGERDAALLGLRRGDLDVVCNADLWVAGVDVPELECVILLRPSKSLTVYLQSVGRGLRVSQGKQCCYVLDHAGCLYEHGPPDVARAWTLERGRRGDKGSVAGVRECPECYAAHAMAPKCPECGYVYEGRPRLGPIQVRGNLGCVDLADLGVPLPSSYAEEEAKLRREREDLEASQRLVEQGRARTMQQLVDLGKRRGYRNPRFWAAKVLASRRPRRH
jgi:DNA repair protein RadD